MDPSLLIFLVAIAIVGVLVFLAISMTGKRSHNFNLEDYQVDFLRIEQSLSKDNASSYAMALRVTNSLIAH